MPQQAIYDAIPHREPFLLVDEIVEQGPARIVCTKVFSGNEDFFAGHYPGMPRCRACCCARRPCSAAPSSLATHLASIGGKRPRGHAHERRAIQTDRAAGRNYPHRGRTGPGLADAFFLKAKAAVDGKVAVRFEFACTAAAIDPAT